MTESVREGMCRLLIERGVPKDKVEEIADMLDALVHRTTGMSAEDALAECSRTAAEIRKLLGKE